MNRFVQINENTFINLNDITKIEVKEKLEKDNLGPIESVSLEIVQHNGWMHTSTFIITDEKYIEKIMRLL